RRRAGRNRTENTSGGAQNPIGIEIAGNNKRRVVGLIVLAVVSLLLLDGGAFHILQPANDRISVWMNFKSSGFHFLQKKTPWGIESGLQLFNDNLLLCFKLVELKGTVHHSVRFNLQSDVPAV